MRLATLKDGGPDGTLILVSRDDRYVLASGICPTLQAALDTWDEVEPRLRAYWEQLESGELEAKPLDVSLLAAPLPRAYEWIDASSYLNHVRLARMARGAQLPPDLEVQPLVYQGGSGASLGAWDVFALPDPSWGLDFEAELCAVLAATPRGVSEAEASRRIRLITMANDWTYRNLVPDELSRGFGFFRSKPATAFGPFAVTPDELGPAWDGERLTGRMSCWLNGERVGRVDTAGGMHFSFPRLIATICETRDVTAGTIVGSGTVSNQERDQGVCCLAERRMLEVMETGTVETPFLRAGDVVRIAYETPEGMLPFGVIEERIEEVVS